MIQRQLNAESNKNKSHSTVTTTTAKYQAIDQQYKKLNEVGRYVFLLAGMAICCDAQPEIIIIINSNYNIFI
jgi:hypothetical protein